MRLVAKSQGTCIEANYPANTTDMSALTFFMGDINMKPKRLVCGVGTNDADYAVEKCETTGYVDGKRKQKRVWVCPYYRAWVNMLNRCYSTKTQDRQPAYKGCSVSDEWLTFSNFKAWMVTQDWQGKQLDKDLLFEGNKVYSSDTCVFVTQTVNLFTNDNRARRGEWMIGADWDKSRKRFRAQCKNPFTRKNEFLGYFDSEQQAHNAWAKRKLELARLLAAEQEDPRVAKALVERYSNRGGEDVMGAKEMARAALDVLPKTWTKTDIQNVADKNEAAEIRKWLSYFAKREGVTVFSKMTGYTTMTVWRVE